MQTDKIKLSDLQISVMKVLWRQQKVTVSEGHQALQATKPMAPTTVATLLKRMADKQVVGFEKVGRQLVYYPLVTESEVKSSMLGGLLNHLFSGSPEELVHHLVNQDEVTAADLDKIKALLQPGESE